MHNNIQDTAAWVNVLNLKASHEPEISSNPSDAEFKQLFNYLYSLILKGGNLVKNEDNRWYIETVDLSLLPLNSESVEKLIAVLDENSLAFLKLNDKILSDRASYKSLIRHIPDFPKEGIDFIDWMPVMNHPLAFSRMIADLCKMVKDLKFTKVAGLESRGFLLGVPIANTFGVGFVPIRKKGKLPGAVIRETYELEYGSDSIEIQEGMITNKDVVLIVDDLLATGGTVQAANNLVSNFTDKFIDLFLIELTFLKGADKIKVPYYSKLKM